MPSIRDLSVATKVLLSVTFLFVVVLAGAGFTMMWRYRDDAHKQMVSRASAFTAVADEARRYQSGLIAEGAIDMKGLAVEAQAHRSQGGDYKDTKLFSAVPVVVGWETAARAAEKENIDFRVIAVDARNPENEPAAGSHQDDTLRRLMAQVKSGGDPMLSSIDHDAGVMRYMRAITLEQSCMPCHGNPATYDTDGDGLDPLGFPMENWDVGRMHGAYEVSVPLSQVNNQIAGFVTAGLAVVGPLGLLGLGGLVVTMRSLLNKPVNMLVDRMNDIADGDGDLTQRLDQSRGDEIGRLGGAFNKFVERVHDVIVSVRSSADATSDQTSHIGDANRAMSQDLSQQLREVEQLAAAAEEMSASVRDVAQHATDATAQASESGRMATSGGEVVGRTIEQMRAIEGAVSNASSSIEALGARSEEIGQVTGVINDIAEQTNMLALNAAIEAARAGEHGRGFAVVADEVRKLADRTTEATEQIRGLISAIQDETAGALDAMSSGKDRVAEGVERASAAGASLQEIVGGAEHVSAAIQQIAAACEQQAGASQGVARTAQTLRGAFESAASNATGAAEGAQQLEQKAAELRQDVARFKVREDSQPG